MFSCFRFLSPFRVLLCVLLCVSPLVITGTPVHAQPMRAADPAPLGQTVHFTLDKDEQKDLAITLSSGQYFLTADIKAADDKATRLYAQIDLLKTNGALIESRVVGAQPFGVAYRLGGKFSVEKPYTPRNRLPPACASKAKAKRGNTGLPCSRSRGARLSRSDSKAAN